MAGPWLQEIGRWGSGLPALRDTGAEALDPGHPHRCVTANRSGARSPLSWWAAAPIERSARCLVPRKLGQGRTLWRRTWRLPQAGLAEPAERGTCLWLVSGQPGLCSLVPACFGREVWGRAPGVFSASIAPWPPCPPVLHSQLWVSDLASSKGDYPAPCHPQDPAQNSGSPGSPQGSWPCLSPEKLRFLLHRPDSGQCSALPSPSDSHRPAPSGGPTCQLPRDSSAALHNPKCAPR